MIAIFFRLPRSYRRLVVPKAIVRLQARAGGIWKGDVQMRVDKAKLEKSVETLMESAGECFDLAKTGHAEADKQHDLATAQHAVAAGVDAHADHLETLGQSLVDGAVELKGEIESEDVRGSVSVPGATPGGPLQPCAVKAPNGAR